MVDGEPGGRVRDIRDALRDGGPWKSVGGGRRDVVVRSCGRFDVAVVGVGV